MPNYYEEQVQKNSGKRIIELAEDRVKSTIVKLEAHGKKVLRILKQQRKR
jgi:hypothetical protein